MAWFSTVRIDLLLVGPAADRAVEWTGGQVVRGARSAAELRSTLARWLADTSAGALLCWDPRLGAPDPARAAALVAGRGDLWHAGLRLGMGGQPGLIDFVAPNWMLNSDPPADREATSWRVCLSACLVRTSVLRQLGLPCAEFDTVTGAGLEWGHRAILRGALLRHVPDLVPAATGFAGEPPTLADEVRFVVFRYGRFWGRWVTARAGLSGYASAGELARAWRAVPGGRPYDEPPGYVTERTLGVPELAAARVTVLIPTLDRHRYLHTVLTNLRAQTVRPHEIIVVDQTAPARRDPAIATAFSDLPLRLMYRDAPGQCSARNAGLRASTGDFILFVDDDDELPPDLIERHLTSLAKYAADVVSGSIQEVGTEALAPGQRVVRASDVFPTGNSLVRRAVLVASGLFDLAFDRAPRADGELGIRIYHSGALMVLDQTISAIHHRAAEGGLRVHGARAVTYRTSREQLAHRHLPHTSEIYLMSRHFTPRQLRESLWLRTFGTLSGRGRPAWRLAKALVGGVQLPDTLRQIDERRRTSQEWLRRFPQIAQLDE